MFEGLITFSDEDESENESDETLSQENKKKIKQFPILSSRNEFMNNILENDNSKFENKKNNSGGIGGLREAHSGKTPSSVDSKLKKKQNSTFSKKKIDKNTYHLTFEEAKALKVGDQIDLRDTVGRFLPSTVIEIKDDSVLRFHFNEWADKYDVDIDYSSELRSMAKLHSISSQKRIRFLEKQVGDQIDVFFENHWCEGNIKKFDFAKNDGTNLREPRSAQIQVIFKRNSSNLYTRLWFNSNDSSMTQEKDYGTNLAKSRANEKCNHNFKKAEWVQHKGYNDKWEPVQIVSVEGNIIHYESARFGNKSCIDLKRYPKALRKWSDGDEKKKRRKRYRDSFEKGLQKMNVNWIIFDCTPDGNCLYRAFSHMIYKHQRHHDQTRLDAVNQIVKFKNFFEPFFWNGWKRMIERKKLTDGTEWGDHVDIIAMAEVYNIRVNIYEYNRRTQKVEIALRQNEQHKTLPIIYLARSNQIHYDLILDKTKIDQFIGKEHLKNTELPSVEALRVAEAEEEERKEKIRADKRKEKKQKQKETRNKGKNGTKKVSKKKKKKQNVETEKKSTKKKIVVEDDSIASFSTLELLSTVNAQLGNELPSLPKPAKIPTLPNLTPLPSPQISLSDKLEIELEYQDWAAAKHKEIRETEKEVEKLRTEAAIWSEKVMATQPEFERVDKMQKDIQNLTNIHGRTNALVEKLNERITRGLGKETLADKKEKNESLKKELRALHEKLRVQQTSKKNKEMKKRLRLKSFDDGSLPLPDTKKMKHSD